MNFVVQTLRESFSSLTNIVFGLACAFLMGLAMYLPANIYQTFTNMGWSMILVEMTLLIAVALLFGINMVLLVQRIRMAQHASTRSVGMTSAASILGILFSGCTACGLTLASYLGLGSLGVLLPWHGSEVKLLAIALLVYSIYTLSKPSVCHFEPKKGQVS